MADHSKNIFYKNSKGKRCSRVSSIKPLIGYSHYFLMQWASNNPFANEIASLAAGKGNITHDVLELDVYDQEYIKTIPPTYRTVVENHLDRWRWFKDVTKCEILETEKVLISEQHSIGGTSDLIIRIPKDVTIKQWSYNLKKYFDTHIPAGIYIFDHKTSGAIYWDQIMQGVAYREIQMESNGYDENTVMGLTKHNNNHIFKYHHSNYDMDRGVGILHFNKTILLNDPNRGFMVAFCDGDEVEPYYELWDMAVQLKHMQPKDTQKTFLGQFKNPPKEKSPEELVMQEITNEIKKVLTMKGGLGILKERIMGEGGVIEELTEIEKAQKGMLF